MAAIQTSGLTKQYGDSILAVSDLNLTVDEGEIFGFLGPNGAGKSTSINMLLDYIRPTEGTATLLGYDAQTEAVEIRNHVGVLPEGATAYERLTGREHLEWSIESQCADNNPDVLLERVGLNLDDANRPAEGYSKGMQQRLGFAMALVGDPELLIFDEPSSGLDPKGMQEMREIIIEEADRGTTIFFSSHILGEVEAVCDRIGIMNKGNLVTTGTLTELRDEISLETSISIRVDRVPADFNIESFDGIDSVTIDGTTITMTGVEPADKVGIVKHVDSVTTVTDIVSEDASLEQLFNSYTTPSQQPEETEQTEAIV